MFITFLYFGDDKGKQIILDHGKIIYGYNAPLEWEHIYAPVECTCDQFIFWFNHWIIKNVIHLVKQCIWIASH